MCEVDLTKINELFGDLDIETKLALHRAFYEGKNIQCGGPVYWVGGVKNPSWYADIMYRVKPEPLKDIELPWEVILPKFKWAARDKGGQVYVFEDRPVASSTRWTRTSACDYIGVEVLVYEPGNKPWEESLIQRPKEVK